jgi:putative ABC transport system ATP-binding protein
MNNVILKTDKLCKNFKSGSQEQQVLKNLNIEIYKNDFTVIMGSSGAGKSTLLYSLSGMDRPTSGKINFFNSKIEHLNNDKLAVFRRDNCGFVFQQMFLLDNMSILDNILASGLLIKKDKKQIVEYAKEMLTNTI